MKISDTTCGSGGMLVVSRKYVEKHGVKTFPKVSRIYQMA